MWRAKKTRSRSDSILAAELESPECGGPSTSRPWELKYDKREEYR